MSPPPFRLSELKKRATSKRAAERITPQLHNHRRKPVTRTQVAPGNKPQPTSPTKGPSKHQSKTNSQEAVKHVFLQSQNPNHCHIAAIMPTIADAISVFDRGPDSTSCHITAAVKLIQERKQKLHSKASITRSSAR